MSAGHDALNVHDSQIITDNHVQHANNVFIGASTQGRENTDAIPNWLDAHGAHSAPLKPPNLYQTARLNKLIDTVQKAFGDSSTKTVLLHGNPGVGKTSAAYGLIKHFFQRYKHGDEVAFMLFDHTRRSEHNARKVLLRLLRWYIGHQHDLNVDGFDVLLKSYKKCLPHDAEDWLETSEECTDLMLQTLSSRSIYLVLDAIDEFTDREQLDELFGQLRRLQDGIGLRLVLTSRFDDVSPKLSSTLAFEIHADERDVEDFAADMFRLAHKEAVNSLRPEDGLHRRAVQAVSTASRGIFLHVRLNVAYICSARNKSELVRLLEELENGEPNYDDPDEEAAAALDRNLRRVFNHGDQQDQTEASDMFAFVLFARRPLTIKELWSAVKCSEAPKKIGLGDLGGSYDISRLTQGLIVVDECLDTVDFISHSLRQYLLQSKPWNEQIDAAEGRLALSCVHYLAMPTFSHGWCTRPELLKTRKKNHPFLEYAARYWDVHYRNCRSRTNDPNFDNLHHAAYNFLRMDGNVNTARQIALLRDPVLDYYHQDVAMTPDTGSEAVLEARLQCPAFGDPFYANYRMNGLHLACLAGLPRLALRLHGYPAHPDLLERTTRDRESAVMFAACSGDVNTVKAVVRLGASLNVKDAGGFTPICRAMSLGHSEIVCWLLSLDVGRLDPMIPITPGKRQDTKFQLHASDIKMGFRGYIRDLQGQTLIHQAAVQGDRDVIVACITRRLNVDAQDGDGKMPCHKAAKYGHLVVLKLLMMNGKFDALYLRSSNGRTPLHMACKYGRTHIVSYLLERHPSLGAIKDHRGNLPVHTAVTLGHEDIVRSLVDHKFGMTRTTNGDDLTPLKLAIRNGAYGPFKILWEHDRPHVADREDFLKQVDQCPHPDIEDELRNYLAQPRRSSTTSFSQLDLVTQPSRYLTRGISRRRPHRLSLIRSHMTRQFTPSPILTPTEPDDPQLSQYAIDFEQVDEKLWYLHVD